MFKCLLLGVWHSLSDPGLDQSLRDVLESFNYRLQGGMAVASHIPGLADGAGITVEGVAFQNNIFVSLSETISSMTNYDVRNWHVDMNGRTLPGWIAYQDGQDFLILNRPLSPETVTLHIQAILDNGHRIGGNFMIDLRTGAVDQIGQMRAQSLTLSGQFEQMAKAERAQDQALLKVLAG